MMVWGTFRVILISTIGTLFCVATPISNELKIMTRDEWNARPPKEVDPMPNPVPYVIIHHSYSPGACNTTPDCIKAMQSMQDYHQNNRTWNDIGYSFGVGGDGNAYEGRGWSAVGAHAPKYNNRSIGICLIGDWTNELPPENQLTTVHQLIDYGVKNGMIKEDYTLLGHRQVRSTECPGEKLYSEIQKWDHWKELEKDSLNFYQGNRLYKRKIQEKKVH